MRLAGRTAIVTGAGSGMGRSIALRFADEGCAVAVVDINVAAASQTAGDVRTRSRKAIEISADVSSIDQVDAMVSTATETFGKIDILVNSAGVWGGRPLLDVQPEEWDKVFAVNARGLFFCMQRVARRMVAQGHGTIINIASVSGFGGRPWAAHYAASKAAVLSVTRSAALALSGYGIRVNAVCPGMVDTPMADEAGRILNAFDGLAPDRRVAKMLESVPLGRTAAPEEIAAVVAFLASADASYITGEMVNVCGGMVVG